MENLYQSYSPSEISSPDSHSHPSSIYKEIIIDSKKAYECLVPHCEKIFRFKSDMERHIIVHTNYKPYACKYPSCTKAFKRPDALKNHTQIHDKGFPFLCNFPGCEAKFNKKSALKYHRLIHNNENFSHNFSHCQEPFLQSQQHQDTISSPISSQKDLVDLDCFFNNFEEYETAVPYQSTITSLDEEFSPKTEKFIHTETGRAASSPKIENDSDYSAAEKFIDICKVQIPKLMKPANLSFEDYLQLSICKYLLQENQEIKAKLDIKSSPSKIEYENQLHSLLNNTLNFQADLMSY